MTAIKKWLRVILYILLGAIAIWLLIASIRAYYFTRTAEKLINQVEPYQQEGTSSERILFIGDSFAYGTGASSSASSLAGLVGEYRPEATVVNKAKNGTKSEDLAKRIESDIDTNYDIIVAIVGSNDIIHPEVDLSKIDGNFAKIYNKASSNAKKVITLTSGDFRQVSFFLSPLNHYFGYRSDEVDKIAKIEASKISNIVYINGFAKEYRPTDSKVLESSDHLHLNDQGYYYWFQRILEKTNNLTFEGT